MKLFFFSIERLSGERSGVPGAKMEWIHYFRNVVKRYSVIIEGWPPEIEFVNLSSASIDNLQKLRRKWKQGTTHWKKLSLAELEKSEKEHDAQIEDGEIQAPPLRRTRSDKGRKRRRSDNVINDDDEDDEDDYIPEALDGEHNDESSDQSCRHWAKRAKQTQ